MDIHTKKKAIELAYHSSLGAKLYLPYVFIFLLLILIIVIYIEVFKNKSSRETLFLATETQQMALEVTSGFKNLSTYYPKKGNDFHGYFEINSTLPSSSSYRVINNQDIDITGQITVASSKSSNTIVNFFNNKGGSITLQYTNNNSLNYLTRVDIIIE